MEKAVYVAGVDATVPAPAWSGEAMYLACNGPEATPWGELSEATREEWERAAVYLNEEFKPPAILTHPLSTLAGGAYRG